MTDHKVIWLQPWCEDCEHCGEDRLWCQDDVWGQCEMCDQKSVRYVIAPNPFPNGEVDG